MKHPLKHPHGNAGRAILALADGTLFDGIAIGANGSTAGEVVFNTAMYPEKWLIRFSGYMAIEGAGYFQMQLPDGRIGYTRDGNFNLSSDGTIVNSDGYQLQPQIQIPEGAQNITIGTDGTVSAAIAGQAEVSEIGKIELARFINPAGLQAEGNNILTETAASGQAQVGAAGVDGRGSIRQASLEGSNVNIVEELVDMIETQRAYEVNSKMISSTDQMLQYVNQNI